MLLQRDADNNKDSHDSARMGNGSTANGAAAITPSASTTRALAKGKRAPTKRPEPGVSRTCQEPVDLLVLTSGSIAHPKVIVGVGDLADFKGFAQDVDTLVLASRQRQQPSVRVVDQRVTTVSLLHEVEGARG